MSVELFEMGRWGVSCCCVDFTKTLSTPYQHFHTLQHKRDPLRKLNSLKALNKQTTTMNV